jgi:hypothetical protein
MNKNFKLPTEVVDLPSKGLLYPESSPLSSGKIEMKYMTAKEEDILTNQNYISRGVVIDKLLQSMIVSKIDYNELLVGDKNAILVAARILGYGKDYDFTYKNERITVDLSILEPKELDETIIKKGKNEFDFIFPSSGTNITFKLLTHKDELAITQELNGLKKINKDNLPELSTRLKYMITSVEGSTERKDIREFVDNYLLAKDSRVFREYVKEIQPDINLTFDFDGNDGFEEGVNIPIGVNFLWPDVTV